MWWNMLYDIYAILCAPHFFKCAALSPHKLPISAQNMRCLHDFLIPAFSLQKSHIYLSRKLKKCCVYFTQEQPFSPVAMGTLWSDVIMRRERHRKAGCWRFDMLYSESLKLVSNQKAILISDIICCLYY